VEGPSHPIIRSIACESACFVGCWNRLEVTGVRRLWIWKSGLLTLRHVPRFTRPGNSTPFENVKRWVPVLCLQLYGTVKGTALLLPSKVVAYTFPDIAPVGTVVVTLSWTHWVTICELVGVAAIPL
jgi:hypothetical protein